jgi:hypothetical protein
MLADDNNQEKDNLEKCFFYFPQFQNDYYFLLMKNVITPTSEGLHWNADKTSLGQYFKNLKKPCNPVKGGFWNPIETTFNIGRGTLRPLVSKNGRGYVKDSEDYEKIKKMLSKCWKNKIGKRGEKKNNEIFSNIKEIIEKTDNENCYEVIQTLETIKNILFTKK